jgi:hypothetical protein
VVVGAAAPAASGRVMVCIEDVTVKASAVVDHSSFLMASPLLCEPDVSAQ